VTVAFESGEPSEANQAFLLAPRLDPPVDLWESLVNRLRSGELNPTLFALAAQSETDPAKQEELVAVGRERIALEELPRGASTVLFPQKPMQEEQLILQSLTQMMEHGPLGADFVRAALVSPVVSIRNTAGRALAAHPVDDWVDTLGSDLKQALENEPTEKTRAFFVEQLDRLDGPRG
jgi:hypothetical protein